MISIISNDLDQTTIYRKVLQLLENITDEYSLHAYFGVLSMSKQEVVEYLLSLGKHFLVDFECIIENDGITFKYQSSETIFDGIVSYFEKGAFKDLTDDVLYQSDYKQIDFTIHVKPKFNIQRESINQISVSKPHFQI